MTAAQWLALGPIVLLIAAVIALAAAWGYLYYKYEELRPLLELFAFVFSPLAGVLFLINRYIIDLGDALGFVIDKIEWIIDKADWLQDHLGWLTSTNFGLGGPNIFGGGGGGGELILL